MVLILELLAAFVASLFFGLLFGIPSRNLLVAGIVGMVGWAVYSGLREINLVLAIFVAAIVISFLCEILARILKKPVTVFVIPGIIPLVPGAGAYYAMAAFMDGNFNLGMAKGAETLLSAGAIAAGQVLVGAIFRISKERYK